MKTKTLLVLALTLSFANVYAQSEEQVLNSAPIDVDGYVSEKQVTDGELEQIKHEIRKQKNEVKLNKDKTKGYQELSRTTEKLSETTEDYLDEKKTAKKDIAAYNEKIKCLMEETPTKDCAKYVRNRRDQEQVAQVSQEVQVQQAAATSVASVPAGSDLANPFEEIKLIPYAGGTQYSGKVEQLESQLAGGLRLESNISPRFSMGIGFGFAQLKTNDFANNQNYMNSYYMGAFGSQGREIQARMMGLDLYGKFFITRGERFRPYLGAALGYSRAEMKYTNNNTYSDPNMPTNNYGNENYQTSYATGTIMGGSEVMITKSFGINLEAAMMTGIGSSVSSRSAQNIQNSPDQKRLRELGNEIINASAMSIFVGGVIIF